MNRTGLRVLVFLFVLTAAVQLCPAAVRITEFLAANDGLVRDEDGDSPDWIEIHNDSSEPVDLGGWHLTDNPRRLTKWTFPPRSLGPGEYLVVFASGKDRTVPGSPLHTGFQLDSDGEFLGLVMPDGKTLSQAFSPEFPQQRANVSYGPRDDSAALTLVPWGTAARVWVPVDGWLDAAWMAVDFNDADWMPARTGIGFDRTAGAGVGLPVLRLDFNDDDSGESGQADTAEGFVPVTLAQNPCTVQGVTVWISPIGQADLDDRDRATPTPTASLTQDQLYDDFIFARGQVDGDGLRVRLTGLAPDQGYSLTIWSYDASSSGKRVSDWVETAGPSPQVLATGYSFDGTVLPLLDGDYSFTASVRSSPEGELQIEGTRNGGSSYGVFLNALQLTPEGYGPLLGTDLDAAMAGRGTSAWVRIPFTVEDPLACSMLRLSVHYDDGFAAYLNGEPVCSHNAPASPAWDSAALAAAGAGQGPGCEEAVIPNRPGLLVSGTNILAIHGLNLDLHDPDFLILPELEAQTMPGQGCFFSPPTPGAANGEPFAGLVQDVQFSPERGFYDAPFSLTLSCATPGAALYWTGDGSLPDPVNGTPYTDPIPIHGTAFVRAAAYLPGHLPSLATTHTYLFLDQVIRQSSTQPGFPLTWQADFPADYGMDPVVVNDPLYAPTLKDDLRSIPTLSIVTDHDSLWGPSKGIYVNSTSAGQAWERAASVELFEGDGTTLFQVDCGLRMQGNASRDNVRTPKHSFRLLFKSAYGPSKLRYDWFPGSPVREFDNLVLRACFTDSWSTRYSPGDGGSRYRPEDSLYLRDVWMKDSMTAMGHLSGRGDFVHVVLNGLYWGLYNVCERLDASFFAHHLGGQEEDWDVMRDFTEVLDGTRDEWDRMMALVRAGVTTEAAYRGVADLVDIENLIDYTLLHILAEAEDWPSHNWYAARRRATDDLPATRWIFLPWDQEIVLDRQVRRNRVNVNNDNTPARIYSQLRAWPEFRHLFGERIQRHLFDDGALTPARNIARLMARATRIDRAIVGESAHWGDAREFPIPPNPGTGQTFTRDLYWVPELEGLCTEFLPALNDKWVNEFRKAGLYP
ncbi:MAG: CotH kinase family protein [Phycisphaerae bacterium]|nr:CotH kinase family protein [Phycisphaerae bacterium]